MFGTKEPRLQPLDAEVRAWANAVRQNISMERLRADVEELPAPRNRLHSPDAMTESERLIIAKLHEAGWESRQYPFEEQNVFGYLDYSLDGFAAGTKSTIYTRLEGLNIVALKEGVETRDAIIVGAHHDTIRDSPGADDNTASVAALLELARVLAPYRFAATILLACFDMEELNFVGSRALLPELSRQRKIREAIIYETMSYTSNLPGSQSIPPGIGLLYPSQVSRIKRHGYTGDWTLVIYRKSATALARMFAEGLSHFAGVQTPVLMRDPVELKVLGPLLERLLPTVRNFHRSDHVCFWQAGIPAIMIGDTANFRNPHYHQPTDTPDTLDYQRLADIVGATAVALARRARRIR